MHKEIYKEFKKLDDDIKNNKIAKSDFFRRISDLDKKYNNNPYYFGTIEGVMSNIGADIKDIDILNCAIKRLKDKEKLLQPNKFYYDLGNSIFSKAYILYDHKDIKQLIEIKEFAEARKLFNMVCPDKSDNFERANTNSANILNRYGRNYEAIYHYDKVLNKNHNFGMALGNKARAIYYYYKLSPYKSLKILNFAKTLFEKSLLDNNLLEVGGKVAITAFNKELVEINGILLNNNFKQNKEIITPKLSKYHKYVLENNLFLNFDFGYYYDHYSIRDNFFPSFTESTKEKKSDKCSSMSEKIYFCFQLFNQVLEDYVTSRYLLFEAIHSNFSKYDKYVSYIYTLDYTKNSINYGILKHIFANLYNCLDKLAHVILFYFNIYQPNLDNINIYFDSLLHDDFKNVVINQKDFQLLALYNLACDFKQSHPYFIYNKLRNKITHSFLCTNIGIAYDSKFKSFEITENELIENVKQMFLIVKAAIMYFILYFENSKIFRSEDVSKLIFPMEAILQKDIYYK